MKHFLALLLIACDCQQNKIPPEQAAIGFADGLALKIQGHPMCAGTDSDCDGYVTCTLALVSEKTPPATMSIQCAATAEQANSGCCPPSASGCKITQPKLTQVTQQ